MARRWGFTGTRKGMTPEQKSMFRTWLGLQSGELHHGDCLGADDDADILAAETGWRRVAHPPINPKLRAFCKADVILEPKEYHARNRDLVDATDYLIATPKAKRPASGRISGTWSTVDYALRSKRPVLIIWPSGSPERWGPWPAVDAPLAEGERPC